jgi:hypothetical protein
LFLGLRLGMRGSDANPIDSHGVEPPFGESRSASSRG